MKAYQKERIENAICFFAYEHFEKTGKYPSQTHIYKYLAFFDFQILEETGEAPLDLDYLAMERGPVPIQLYKKRREIKSDCFCFQETGTNNFIVKAVKKPDLHYFSEYETEKMKNLIYIFATSYTTASIISDASHKKIKAWAKAWNRKKNSPIDKAETFDDIYKKTEGELTQQEEHFLINQSIKRIKHRCLK